MSKFFFDGDPELVKNAKKQIDQALQKVAKQAQKLLLQPTSTWQHGVSFPITKITDGVEVSTSDSVYGILDEDSPPHRIAGNPFLAFATPFGAKTTVGSLNAGPGTVGGNTVYTAEVSHPGHKGRDFTGQVIKRVEPDLQKEIEAAIESSIT
jgi:hypothetical protein